MKRLFAGILTIGLIATGCGDDDDDDRVDAGFDAGAVDAGEGDAGEGDAGEADAGEADGGTAAAMFDLSLTTAAEVPVCDAAGSGAMGSATVTIDAANTMIVVSNLTYTGLSGPATGAHIHFGGADVAGPIVLGFGDTLTSPINRTFTAADYPSPVPAGVPADFAAFVQAMRDGDTYINIHTADCMPGEIRAQIE